jgi:hypothetical protein
VETISVDLPIILNGGKTITLKQNHQNPQNPQYKFAKLTLKILGFKRTVNNYFHGIA